MAQRGRPELTIWRMRNACWVTKATDTHRNVKHLLLFRVKNVRADAPWRHDVTFIHTLLSCDVDLITNSNFVPHNINCLAFITEMESAYRAVRPGSLN